MVILSFMIQYMLRVNISIAIVEMVSKNDSNSTKTHGPRYDWNENQKNDILGIFFWGYIITQIPAGRFSEIFGTKIVVGTGVLIASLLTVLVPMACNLHYYLIAVFRFCTGMSLGVLWPSIPPMATKWSSSTGTSMFMSHMFASALGAALTLPVCGYLIDNLGWPIVFYATGSIGLIWTTAWFYLVYDTPAQHPRINVEERENLERRNTFNMVKNYETPWKQILTSAPMWAYVGCNTSASIVTYFVLNHLPTYLDQILHFNIKQNGWLSSLPNIGDLILFTNISQLVHFSKIHHGRRCILCS
jgi:ACS family sodium-dependent inorganic phosphate cotransporter